MLNWYSLVSLVAMLLFWMLAAYVLTRSPRGAVSLAATATQVAAACFLLGQLMEANAPTVQEWLAWSRPLEWSATIAPALWYWLTVLLLREQGARLRRYLRIVGYPLGVVLGLGAIVLAVASIPDGWLFVWSAAGPLPPERATHFHFYAPATGAYSGVVVLVILATAGAIANACVGWRLSADEERRRRFAWLALSAVLLIYLGTVHLFGVRLARLTAELFPPSGQPIRGSATVGGIRGGENHLTFGPAAIEGDTLSFETPELSGVLTYHSRFAPCELRRPFLSAEGRSLTWSVEVPDADVTGRIHWPGGSMEVRGRGYRDRVWFDLLPWRFPIRELVWGRAAAGNHAATWVRASTLSGVVGASWVDGEIVPDAGGGLAPDAVALGSSRAFLDADLTDLKGLRLGWLRGVVNALGAGLHETKYQASCLVHGAPGVAVHEVVRWPALA